MKSEFVTQWINFAFKPVHIGVYQVIDKEYEIRFSLWDGVQWNLAHPKFFYASRQNDKSAACYNGFAIGWRGVAK